MHQLLPWYVNKTLGPEATAEFEAHLVECLDCRGEMKLLEKMRAQLERHGEAVLSDHPTPEELVAAVTGNSRDLPPGRPEEVRRHIALCASCADEARWVLRGTEVGTGRAGESESPLPSGASAWRWLLPWLLPVAATLVLLFGAPWFDRPGDEAANTGIVPFHLVERTQRGEDGPTVVEVASKDDVIRLIFPVDAAPDMFPLQFQIVDSAGVIVRQDQADVDDVVRELFVMQNVSRDECPDGEYVARMLAANGSDEMVEYLFRVTTRP